MLKETLSLGERENLTAIDLGKKFPEVREVGYTTFRNIPTVFTSPSDRLLLFLDLINKTPEFFRNEFKKNPKEFSDVACNEYKIFVERVIEIKHYYNEIKNQLSAEEKVSTAFAFLHAYISISASHVLKELTVDCLPPGHNIEDYVAPNSEEFRYLKFIKENVMNNNFLSQELNNKARNFDFVSNLLNLIKNEVEAHPDIVLEKYKSEINSLLSFNNLGEMLSRSYFQLIYNYPGIQRFNTQIVDSFSKITDIDKSKFRIKIFTTLLPKDFGKLCGKTASSGKVSGVAKICNSYTEAAEKIKDGDILICPTTDPNWIIFMKKAAAIVTETGGILSHTGVVAREMNIPAIVGVQNATKLIKNGSMIEVDADSGKVTILN